MSLSANKGILFTIFISCTLLLCGCEELCNYSVVKRDPLSNANLKLIPYLVNDSLRFANTNGDVLTYVCTERKRRNHTNDKNINSGRYECQDIYDTDDGTNWIYLEDKLLVDLICLTNPFYDLHLELDSYPGSFNIVFPNQPIHAQANLKNTSLAAGLNDISSCGLYSNACLGNVVVNNKTYPNVSKWINTNIYPGFDSCYYSNPNGLLKFCIEGECWSLK